MAGIGEKIKGAAEKVWGNVTGSTEHQVQGELRQAEGQARMDANRNTGMGGMTTHSTDTTGSGFGHASDTTGVGYGTSDARGTTAHGTVSDTSNAAGSTIGGMAQTAKGYIEKGVGNVIGDPARQMHGEGEKLHGQAQRAEAGQQFSNRSGM